MPPLRSKGRVGGNTEALLMAQAAQADVAGGSRRWSTRLSTPGAFDSAAHSNLARNSYQRAKEEKEQAMLRRSMNTISLKAEVNAENAERIQPERPVASADREKRDIFSSSSYDTSVKGVTSGLNGEVEEEALAGRDVRKLREGQKSGRSVARQSNFDLREESAKFLDGSRSCDFAVRDNLSGCSVSSELGPGHARVSSTNSFEKVSCYSASPANSCPPDVPSYSGCGSTAKPAISVSLLQEKLGWCEGNGKALHLEASAFSSDALKAHSRVSQDPRSSDCVPTQTPTQCDSITSCCFSRSVSTDGKNFLSATSLEDHHVTSSMQHRLSMLEERVSHIAGELKGTKDLLDAFNPAWFQGLLAEIQSKISIIETAMILHMGSDAGLAGRKEKIPMDPAAAGSGTSAVEDGWSTCEKHSVETEEACVQISSECQDKGDREKHEMRLNSLLSMTTSSERIGISGNKGQSMDCTTVEPKSPPDGTHQYDRDMDLWSQCLDRDISGTTGQDRTSQVEPVADKLQLSHELSREEGTNTLQLGPQNEALVQTAIEEPHLFSEKFMLSQEELALKHKWSSQSSVSARETRSIIKNDGSNTKDLMDRPRASGLAFDRSVWMTTMVSGQSLGLPNEGYSGHGMSHSDGTKSVPSVSGSEKNEGDHLKRDSSSYDESSASMLSYQMPQFYESSWNDRVSHTEVILPEVDSVRDASAKAAECLGPSDSELSQSIFHTENMLPFSSQRPVPHQQDGSLLLNDASQSEGLSKMGRKTATAGWFASEGEGIVLAHNDGSCSFYDVSNMEEKAQFQTPVGCRPRAWHDCWLIRAAGTDGRSNKYVVAASAPHAVDTGFCVWDFQDRSIAAYHCESSLPQATSSSHVAGSSKLFSSESQPSAYASGCDVPASRMDTKVRKPELLVNQTLQLDTRDPCSPGQSQTPLWWYRPCGPLLASAGCGLNTLGLYDIRDGDTVMRWEANKIIAHSDLCSPLQWRNKGKIVVALEEGLGVWDVNSMSARCLQSINIYGQEFCVMCIQNADAEFSGGVRQRRTPADNSKGDGVLCSTQALNVLDFRLPSGIAFKMPSRDEDIKCAYAYGDSIFTGTRDQNLHKVIHWSIRQGKPMCTYNISGPGAETICQVWGSSETVMAVTSNGLAIFDSSGVANGSEGFHETIGSSGLLQPTFDYSSSRVLLISKDRPASWCYWP